MSRAPPPSTSSTSFEKIFTAASKEYKKQTKRDIASHPLATRLQSCDSPDAILAVLLDQVQKFDQSQSVDEKWWKWVDPTVNVLFAFSATLGNGVGLIFPPANTIFTGIGILLQAIKDVRASQSALVDLFSRLEFFFKRLEKYVEVRPTAAMTDIIVKIMVEVLSILGIVTKEIGQGRTKAYLKKLIGRKDVEDALQRLDQLTQEEARMAAAETLTITRGIDDKVQVVNERVHSVDMKVEGIDDKVRTIDHKVQSVDHKVSSVIQGVKETGVTIQQVAVQVIDLHRNQLRKDLRKWVAPPDPSVNYNSASGTHHEGTASWCTKGKTPADWKTSGSLLWIHGKPGSGKSILSSVIIRDIKSTCRNSGSAFLAYFYFDFKDTAKQDARALLSSLLVQLSDRSDIFCDALSSLYSAHNGGSEQPTDDSLAQCLKDMLTMMGQIPIYLVIDALDECPNDSGIPSSREKVLELVNGLIKLRHSNLRLCITSRPELDIRSELEPLATQQVSLHDESGQRQDINDYVTFVVHSDRRMARWRDGDKDAVIENLTEKADGMFRWVFCQLEVLRQCFPTDVRRILKELPESLDDTYERILKQIHKANVKHAYRLLQCLSVAIRPLRVEELAEVLALDLSKGAIPTLNVDWRWEDQEEAVLSACSSLVAIIIDNGSRIVQFSHFSVKEFLTSDRLAGLVKEASRFHIPIEPSHVFLSQACLGVLLRLDDSTDKDSVKDIPLFQYSDAHWVAHVQIGNVELQIKDALDRFFDMDKPHFSAWVRVQERRHFLKVSKFESSAAAALYLTAMSGFRHLVERLIIKHPQQVNHLGGGLYGTPLHASVLGKQVEVSRLLFVHGAYVDSRSMDKCTPLHLAASLGHLELVRLLLVHGAEVNARNDQEETPLFRASENGDHHVVQLLLDYNADEHVRANGNTTPLLYATAFGRLEVARILLTRHADVNARDANGGSSFLHAAHTGITDLVLLLLDYKADEHARDNSGNTALHFAVARGFIDVARLLIERGAGVNVQNDTRSTPLHRASEGLQEGNTDAVRFLLDHGADAQARNLSGKTAAEVARGPKQQEIVEVLSQHARRGLVNLSE